MSEWTCARHASLMFARNFYILGTKLKKQINREVKGGVKKSGISMKAEMVVVYEFFFFSCFSQLSYSMCRFACLISFRISYCVFLMISCSLSSYQLIPPYARAVPAISGIASVVGTLSQIAVRSNSVGLLGRTVRSRTMLLMMFFGAE